MFVQQHQCYQCGSIHSRPAYPNPKHFGYPCPKCSAHLEFPLKSETKAWNRQEGLTLAAFIAFPTLIFQVAFKMQSVSLTITLLVAWVVLYGFLYRFKPAPICLKHIDQIYPPEEKQRIEGENADTTDIDTHIARYLSKQQKLKQSKAWWQFWL